MKNNYFIADDNGTIYGHDMTKDEAENVLAYVIEQNPDIASLNPEIMSEDEED